MAQNKGLQGMSWILVTDEFGDSEIASGGLVVRAKAAAALNVGDAVFLSADGTVNKSTTAGNHLLAPGIVIGGRQFGRQAIQRVNDVGAVAAAAANEEVYVCIHGLCYAVSGAAITIGQSVKSDTGTAGRVIAGTVSTDHGKMLGKAWQAAGGAAVKILILVSLH